MITGAATDPPAPHKGPIAATLVVAIRLYRLLFSAWIGNVCRFEPSCSRYAQQAIERHGAARGAALAARRLLRCHPWCEGGHDPVPGLFTSLIDRADP